MYLLIRMWAYNKQIGLSFTFHNVSINSILLPTVQRE